VSEADKFNAERKSNITAPDDQNAHGSDYRFSFAMKFFKFPARTVALICKMRSSRKYRGAWMIGFSIVLLGILILCGSFGFFRGHQHCIKQTAMALRLYASDHHGRFPFHTNGYGDAILLLAREDIYNINLFTAPGDDGKLLKECLEKGATLPEGSCSRAYVQGLTTSESPEIALVFDRYPTRGGDHSRNPWAPLMREVCFLDGSTQVIREKDWPAFRLKQFALLSAAGIDPARAAQLYSPVESGTSR
jgi:hypothetical protein